MTDSEKAEHKEKVRKVMMDHLTTLGWPKLTDEQVMSQLKPMWLKIEEANLVTGDMNWMAFQAIANNAYMLAQVQDIMGI